jgi:hypothetical protein
MKKGQLRVWRVVIGAFVLVLTPLSLWYAVCAVTALEYTPHVSNLFELVSRANLESGKTSSLHHLLLSSIAQREQTQNI